MGQGTKMANLTDYGNNSRIQDLNCTTGLYGAHQKIVIAALNCFLSITAFLGNVLIIIAFQKVRSFHPPSRLLLSCLAFTDLCVGLIAQPLYASFLLSQEHSKHCYYFAGLSNVIAVTFCGVSLLTMTGISVDRLLALLLGLRYRQVVTLRRTRLLVVIFWLGSIAFSIILVFYHDIAIRIMYLNMLLCIVTSTFCYIKIYVTIIHHRARIQEQAHQQPNGRGPLMNIARYRKTVSIAFWVQMTLLACYIPYGIISIFAHTGLRSPSFDLAWDSTLTLLFLNSTLNPFLYCWKIRHLRQTVIGMVKGLCCSSTESRVQWKHDINQNWEKLTFQPASFFSCPEIKANSLWATELRKCNIKNASNKKKKNRNPKHTFFLPPKLFKNQKGCEPLNSDNDLWN